MPPAALARLSPKPPAERRIAIILSGSSGTPQTAAKLLAALRDAGYRVEAAPDDDGALTARLAAGPEETLSFATYSAVFATLPLAMQQQVSSQWGAAERDPRFRPGRLDCGRFVIPALRCGNVAVLVLPVDGDPAPVPPHSSLAAYAWLGGEFRADAVIELGPSANGLAEAVLGPVPHLSLPVADGEIGRCVVEAIERGEP